MKNWQIHKFGGTSMASSASIKQVAEIILNQDFNHPQGVIVSAMAGVTDDLLKLCLLAQNHQDYSHLILEILHLHQQVIHQLNLSPHLINQIKDDLSIIETLLQSITISKQAEPLNEIVSGYGEIWSSLILSAYLNNFKECQHLNALEFLTITPQLDGNDDVNLDISQEKLRQVIQKSFFVATGYIAIKENGTPTTLKRNGSDYSAALIANLLDAQSLTIWKDVDGVLCADPRKVKEAEIVRFLNYDEILELAYFGAKVIHPKAITPLIAKNITLRIKNTFKPQDEGTAIGKDLTNGKLIKGFSSIDQVALLNVEGKGLIGVPGIASKIFLALKQVNISVILISQGSSEYSICLAVKKEDGLKAKATLDKEFALEIQKDLIKSVEIQEDCAIVAIVGNNMSHKPGVAGKIFSLLGQAQVNIKAIAQGSSERNISLVINSRDLVKALNSLYYGLYKEIPEVSLALIGPGMIGKTFLKQLKEVEPHLGFKVNIKAIASSKQLWLGNDLSESSLQEQAQVLNLDQLQDAISHNGSKIIVDCTSSPEIAQKYNSWLHAGIHIITPNKKANGLPMVEYQKLHQHPGKYFYETTVGAGLPVISTLKELKLTGDKILKIEGVLSGTLSYIFNNLGSRSFSEVLLEAKHKGFTEPDPRDDLSGMDVARKILILAREMNLNLNLEDIAVENLVQSHKLQNASLEDFLNSVDQLDAPIAKIQEQNPGKVLRYLAEASAKGVKVGLTAVDLAHPLASLSGAENIFIITTERYQTNPLIIRGPGAGAEVTAAGVLGDLIKLLNLLQEHR